MKINIFILAVKQLFTYSISIIIAWTAFFSSCVKESDLEIETDTIKIAKVYQPNEIDGKDAVIQSYSPNINFGETPHLTVLAWTVGEEYNTVRSLIEFNLTDIEPQTKIKAAFLSFYFASYQSFTQHEGNNTFTISRIDQMWNQNEVNWINQPSTVNDNTIIYVSKSNSSYQSYADIEVTEMVQDMINYPESNHGFMLKLVDEVPTRSVVILASSNYIINNVRPQLIVYY